MRRRVRTVYVTLLVVTCLGLALPLCGSIAARGTSEMLLDRINDTARLSGVAEPSVLTGSAGTVSGELAAYDELYGVTGVVLDRDGGVVASSRAGLDGTGLEEAVGGSPAELPAEVRTALAGGRAGADTVVWPWNTEPLVVAEPIGSGEIVGAVVTSSPTGGLRRAILLQWLGVWAVALSVLVAGIVAAGPLTRWVLRPIDDLDEATRAVSGGSLDARVPAGEGPLELRRLGESFNRMADTITSMLESQRTFVAYAGHQVRNPLAALRLRVESLGRHMPEAGTREHRLALDEVDRLTRICDSLLTLAHSGDTGHALVEEELCEAAEDRVAAWQPIAERAGARLECGGDGTATVHCVEGTLEQALDALIDNALKYGGAGAHIRVLVEAPAAVRVVDDGPGLPAEQLAEATRPFWRDGGPGGSGLGLSIVVTLLEMQGGTLTLGPADPHGIDARVDLPVTGGPPTGRVRT